MPPLRERAKRRFYVFWERILVGVKMGKEKKKSKRKEIKRRETKEKKRKE